MEKLTDKESFELEFAIRKYIDDLEEMRGVAIKACQKDYQYVVDILDKDLAVLRSMQKKIHHMIENKKI